MFLGYRTTVGEREENTMGGEEKWVSPGFLTCEEPLEPPQGARAHLARERGE